MGDAKLHLQLHVGGVPGWRSSEGDKAARAANLNTYIMMRAFAIPASEVQRV